MIIVSPSGIDQLLEYNWSQNKMLNILGAHIKNDNISIVIYDPFWINLNNTRGKITERTLVLATFKYIIKSTIKKLKNLLFDVKGYPIRVCIFEIQGQVKIIKNSDGTIRYTGSNLEMLSLILDSSNFTQTYVSPPPGTNFGGNFNGTPTGQIWMMETGQADVVSNMRMIVDFNLKNSTFLTGIEDSTFRFMTHRVGEKYQVEYLKIFQGYLYIFIALSHMSVLSIWVYGRRLKQDFIKKYSLSKKQDSMRIFMLLFGAATMVAQPSPKLVYERFLFGSMLLLSLVLSCTYQGIMYKFLSIGRKSLDINTLEGLVNSNLDIIISMSYKPPPYVVLDDSPHDMLLKKATYITNIKENLDKVRPKK